MAGETAHVARTFAEQLPILQVVIPLIAAPICVVLGNRNAAWAVAMIASVACLLVSWALLGDVRGGDVVSYHLGGWAPPLGIEYRIDALNALILFLISAMAVLVAFGSSLRSALMASSLVRAANTRRTSRGRRPTESVYATSARSRSGWFSR